jgi:tetratricopeptide (TPR) repeat protein
MLLRPLNTRFLFIGGLVAFALAAGAPSARADGFVITTGGRAQDCYMAAKAGAATPRNITLCTEALDQDLLDRRDRAGTHINRGTLQLKLKAYPEALTDFDAAIALAPELGEAHLNRAAALIGLRRYADAVASASRSIELKTSEPEKAYFNRATARELTDDVKGAYQDYTTASEIAPNWEAPKAELKRFKVSSH